MSGTRDNLSSLVGIVRTSPAELLSMQVPYFDMEVIGIYPLRYMAQVAFKQVQG